MPRFDSYAMLCCAVLCCAVLCCAVLCCAVLCCAVLRCRQCHGIAGNACTETRRAADDLLMLRGGHA